MSAKESIKKFREVISQLNESVETDFAAHYTDASGNTYTFHMREGNKISLSTGGPTKPSIQNITFNMNGDNNTNLKAIKSAIANVKSNEELAQALRTVTKIPNWEKAH